VPTASIQTVRLVIAAAASRGVSPPALIAELGLAPAQLLDPDARVPAELALRAWKVAARLSGDAAFGLATVEHLRPDMLGGLGWAIHASATVGAGLERMSRFLRLGNQYTRLVLVEEAKTARLRMEIDYEIDPDELRHPVECLLWGAVTVLRRATGQPIAPLAVSFRHPAPSDLAPHHQRFAVTPAFAAPQSELVLARDALDIPHLAPDPQLTAVTERHLRRLLDELPAVETFAGRVKRVVAEELRHGEPTLPQLAARLKLSERTLQRRLRQESLTLQQLLDAVRLTLAKRHLRESRESIAEISFLLGFSEVRAFHRAFKRWTGVTPNAFRTEPAAP
jgi:AraC-like DNA-binding protein